MLIYKWRDNRNKQPIKTIIFVLNGNLDPSLCIKDTLLTRFFTLIIDHITKCLKKDHLMFPTLLALSWRLCCLQNKMGIVLLEEVFQSMKSVCGDGGHRRRTSRKCLAVNEPGGEKCPISWTWRRPCCMDYFKETRRSCSIYNCNLLKSQGPACEKDIAADTFKTSQSWCYKFLARNGFSIRRRTTVAQKLHENFEDKLINFQQFILWMRQCYDYDLSMTGNADQISLTFDIASNMPVSSSGIKSMPIISTEHKKDPFTMMLACRGDGSKLPLMLFSRGRPCQRNSSSLMVCL